MRRRGVLAAVSGTLTGGIAGCFSDPSRGSSLTDRVSDDQRTTQPSPSGVSTRSPSACSEELVAIDGVQEAELEDGTYEIVPFGNLSETQQQTFEQALEDGRAPLVEKKESWYRYVEYQHSKQRLKMVVGYSETLYGVEVHHLDYC